MEGEEAVRWERGGRVVEVVDGDGRKWKSLRRRSAHLQPVNVEDEGEASEVMKVVVEGFLEVGFGWGREKKEKSVSLSVAIGVCERRGVEVFVVACR